MKSPLNAVLALIVLPALLSAPAGAATQGRDKGYRKRLQFSHAPGTTSFYPGWGVKGGENRCHPDEFFVSLDPQNTWLVPDRFSTWSSGEKVGGQGFITYRVHDEELNVDFNWTINCGGPEPTDPNSPFLTARFKPDPRVKLTPTCDRYLDMISQEPGSWRQLHEVCREFQTQLVEALSLKGQSSVAVEVEDGKLVLPFEPVDRTPE
jgi:hypothetical protein